MPAAAMTVTDESDVVFVLVAIGVTDSGMDQKTP